MRTPSPDEKVPVFSPVDEDLRWKFNGVYLTLKANDITPVPYRMVPVLLTQLGELGVSEIPRGVSKEEVDKVIHEAELKFWQNQKNKNEQLVLTEAEKEAKREAAQLPVDESEEVQEARKWLAEHRNPPLSPEESAVIAPTVSKPKKSPKPPKE